MRRNTMEIMIYGLMLLLIASWVTGFNPLKLVGFENSNSNYGGLYVAGSIAQEVDQLEFEVFWLEQDNKMLEEAINDLKADRKEECEEKSTDWFMFAYGIYFGIGSTWIYVIIINSKWYKERKKKKTKIRALKKKCKEKQNKIKRGW